ncbi:MAG TPA: right-handed parallel beta-helix repeat-containing protein [Actinomycetota bacterium]|nr:right-handed parallel beta-helix repeat-containing protein [Actinomycetota bacterium]
MDRRRRRVLAAAITATLAVLVLPASATTPIVQPQLPPQPTLCLGTIVLPGDSIQTAVDGQSEGTTFCLLPGIYRLRFPVFPKNGQTFVGQPGAIVMGSETVTFEQDGNTWVSSGNAQEPTPAVTKCARRARKVCNMPFRLFRDDARMRPVASAERLGPGKFFFDLAQDTVRISEDPAGHVFELGAAPLAFTGTRVDASANDVTIRGLEFQYFANQRIGVISTFTGRGWLIEDNIVHHSHGCGIYGGTQSVVRGNFVHHMGQLGLCGQGEDILVEDNEIANNNLDGFDPRWEAGGAKWVNTTRLTVRNNLSHDNKGPGLWTDGNNIDTVYEGNTVENNTEEGIFHEISYDAIIRNNTVRNNGHELGAWGSGIQVSSSRNVEIFGNTVDGPWNGISLLQERRGKGTHGAFRLTNASVHDNNVTMRVGTTGAHRPPAPTVALPLNAITFRGNNYTLGPGKHFAWGGKTLSFKRWRALGMDVSGKASRSSGGREASPAPAAAGTWCSPGCTGATTASVP